MADKARQDLDPQSESEMTYLEMPWQFQGTVKRPPNNLKKKLKKNKIK